MKLTLTVFLICLMGVSASTYSQTTRLDITLKNGNMVELIKQIESKSEFFFYYQKNELSELKDLNVKAKNATVMEILDKVTKGTAFDYTILDRYIVVRKTGDNFGNDILATAKENIASQQRSVSGKVTDTNNQPLPGVTILIKGAVQGTVSDINGDYSLTNITDDAILVFSFVGMMTQEVVVGSQTIINVSLVEEVIGIEEVVAIGYGTMKQKDLTGSITTVSAKEFNTGAYVNVVQVIQGKVPGLSISKDGDPNGGTSILLRGASTLRGGSAQSPLYVIDGVPGGMMSSMDDVLSIDILRDASATAIYGARAANGVIMITTKRGEENSSKISYNGYMGVETISNKIEMMSGAEYRNFLKANNLVLDPANEDGVDRNWQNEVTRVGVSHNNYLSVSGGSSKTTYFASAAYKSIDGIIRETGRNILSFMANVQQKAIQDRLKVGLTVNTSVTNGKTYPINQAGENQPFLFAMLHYWPTVVDTHPDGTPKENYVYGSPNPNNLITNNKNSFDSKSILFTGDLEFNILEGWDFNAIASYKSNQSTNNRYFGKYSRFAVDLNGLAIRNTNANEMKVMEAFTSYAKKLGEHDVKLMAGYSWQEEISGDGFQTANTNFVSDAISYYNLALGSGYDNMKVPYGTYGVNTLRLISGYLRLNYAYKDRYLLQATVRRDGSSAFGPNNRWGYFPSFSAGWRVTEESFMQSQNIFSNLKLRVGYGVSGNSLGFHPLLWRTRYSSAPNDPAFYYQGEYIRPIKVTQNENPDLKWESTSMLNMGIDFAILNGRINGTVEWYDKKTTDLIWDYPVSASQYYVNTLTANVGEIENKGWEIMLNFIPVQTSDIVWNTSFNISFNKNKVVSISSDELKLDYIRMATNIGNDGQTGNFAQIIKEGYPIGQFYLWEFAGSYDAAGLSQFYDRDGNLTTTPSSEDHHFQGNAQPKVIFGWHNSFTWERFNLDFLFRGLTGNQILNTTLADLNNPGLVLRRNLPKSSANESYADKFANYTSSRYLEKGDYIRLDNITLSYQFKMNNEYVKNLRVYGTVNNAFVITNYKGLDPEVSLGGSTPGIDNGNYYPQTRTFMLGVNVDF